jgi:hypothetical protein
VVFLVVCVPSSHNTIRDEPGVALESRRQAPGLADLADRALGKRPLWQHLKRCWRRYQTIYGPRVGAATWGGRRPGLRIAAVPDQQLADVILLGR